MAQDSWRGVGSLTSGSDPSYPEIPDNSERVCNKYSQVFLHARFGLGDVPEVTGDIAPEVTPEVTPEVGRVNVDLAGGAVSNASCVR